MDKPVQGGDSKPFSRFDEAMKTILSVPKSAVVAEENRLKEQRKADRAARKAHRPA